MIDFFARSSLAGFVLAISIVAGAQPYAPGEAVVFPGAEIADWGRVEKVDGHFGRPSANTAKVPAVLILHGSGGIDGRGAYYAKALQDAGIATLEITMFAPGGRPRSGTKATMPFAAAALKWLLQHLRLELQQKRHQVAEQRNELLNVRRLRFARSRGRRIDI